MSSSFETGASVWVSTEGESQSWGKVNESGTVLEVGCEYYDEESGERYEDGIMVKLQISNTKGTYPPSAVKLFGDDSPGRNRTISRRNKPPRVTPPPTSQVNNSLIQWSDESDANNEKVDANEGDSDADDESEMSDSKYFGMPAASTKKTSSSSTSSSSSSVDFRVQKSPSSSAKCPSCESTIKKGELRLKPLSSKGARWYHVACAKTTFGSIQASEDMEDYEDLDFSDQHTLRKLLSGENVDNKNLKSKPAAAAKTGTSTAKTKAKAKARRKKSSDDEPLEPQGFYPTKKKATPKPKTAAKSRAKKGGAKPAAVRSNDTAMIVASETDSDDFKDMPFRVEYAATGRATCKGCDERIPKGAIRVAERPLFRGKPGFVVYRHLNCAIFSEDIHRIQDVGGWRKLQHQDRDLLFDRVEESKILIEKENQELQPDELVQTAFTGETRKPPSGLKGNLLPFQVEGLSWMIHQELHIPEIRGGILADEMGMGKTLQTITTILDNRPKLQHAKPNSKHLPNSPDLEERKREEGLWSASLKSFHHEMEMNNVPKKLYASKKKGSPPGARGGTLVVCPLIALTQWQQEIEKFTEEGVLSVCAYHGPNRATEYPRDLLCKYDVVMTTYQVLESDFRKMISPNKVKCPNCGGKYKIDKLRVHLKYFCGASAQRTEAQSRQHRTAERHRQNGNAGGDGGRRGNEGGNAKKKSFSTTKAKTKASSKVKKVATTKKVVGVKRRAGYDSDSDLSVDEDLDVTSPRPRRAAAKSASTKLSASVSQWTAADSDSSGFSESSGDEESDSSSSAAPVSKKKVITPSISDSESSDSSGSDEEALARARKRQRLALKNAKTSNKKSMGAKKGKNGVKGKGKSKGKGKHRPTSGGKRKKPPLPDDSSEDDSSDESSDGEEVDPMEGIDMDELIEEAMAGSRASMLHTICWWRVVLDEAHMIKSRSSQTAASAFALTSIHRWCLSGTPLQNRVGELYSLIRFLRIDPMAHYFCRKQGCDCKSIHYRMQNGRCQDCGCGSIQHFSHFNKHVLNPIQRAGYQGDGRRAMMKLKNEVLDKSLIRRTKQTRAEDMNLPPRVVNIRTIRLHPREEDFYNSLYTETKSSFSDYVAEGTLLNNYAHIFDLLTKMRQAVDHPYLLVYSAKNAGKLGARRNAPAVANGSIDCDLCHEPPTDRVVSSCCGAAFCRGCVIDFMSATIEGMDQQGGTRCPSCRAPFTVDLSQESKDLVDDSTLQVSGNQRGDNPSAGMPSLKEMTHVSSGSILRRINLAEFATSTKIEALVEELVQMRRERPGSKALVFSQFVNMLDLVRWRLHSDPCLHDLGLGVRIIHGGMNIKSRDAALKDFREDNSVRVLLMSLKAGGVALNLTVANEAYLLDPWWNPAAEMQAIDRTHRLGQYRPIRAVRFIAEGTVEERVLQLQEKKRLVFDGTVGRDAASLKMLTVDDMKAMFA